MAVIERAIEFANAWERPILRLSDLCGLPGENPGNTSVLRYKIFQIPP
jgi:hypothetical protein